MGYFLGEGVPFWYTNPQYKGVGYPEWYTIRDYMGCRGDFNTPQKYTIIQKKTIKGMSDEGNTEKTKRETTAGS